MCDALGKIVSTIFNIALFLTGVGFIVIGGLVGKEFKDFADAEIIRPLYIWGLVGVTCAIGVTHMLAAILGVVGTLGENKRCAVQTYISILLVILSLQIASFAVAVHYKNKIEGEVEDTFRTGIRNGYRRNDPNEFVAGILDVAQQAFSCCGSVSSRDYIRPEIAALTGKVSPPDSCCREIADGCATGQLVTSSRIFQEGCVREIENLYGRYTTAVLIVGGIFVGLEIVSIIYSFSICCGGSPAKGQVV